MVMWPSVVVAAWLVGMCLGASPPQPYSQDSLCFSPFSTSFVNPPCHKDASCNNHGDCCHDSQYYDETQEMRNLSVCVEYYQQSWQSGLCKDHMYMKATCSQDWNDTDVEALCLKGNTIPDFLESVPISGYEISRTFVNTYCAICNREDLTDAQIWNSYVVCDGASVTTASDGHLLPSNDHYENYTISYNEGTWGVIPPGLGVSAFIPCHTTFQKPGDKYTRCETPLPPDTIPSHPTLTMSLTVNLPKCGSKEVYDSLSDKCRKIICPNPGEEFRFGRCVPKLITQETLCPFSHSCFLPGVYNRGCFCDAYCKVRGDCCYDSQYYDETQEMRNLSVCVEYYQQSWQSGLCKDHMYMKATCSQDWNDTDVQALCLKGNAIPDMLKGVPVTGNYRTYVNTYCAICNGEDLTDTQICNSYVVCDGASVTTASDGHLLPSNDHYENYTISYNEGTWGVIPPGLGVSAFIPCHTTFQKPGDKYTRCETPLPPDTIPSHPTLTMSLTVNLPKCGFKEVYDSLSDKCRKIICPNPGEEFRFGRCGSMHGDTTPSIQDQESPCPLQHFCSTPGVPNRGCSCDASCKVYGDCCRDSHYYNETEQIKNMGASVCVDITMIDTGVYMRSKCSEAWDDDEVQALCLKGDKTPDHAKLLPVTSTTTAITYVNYYCAVCNGEDTTHLTMWYAKVKCEHVPYVKDYGIVGDQDYSVAFHEGSWGIIVPSQGLQSFKPCFLDFEIPKDVQSYIRQCQFRMVNTCRHWAQQHEWVLCQSYAATVYQGYLIFRNQHCAACNGYEQYDCTLTCNVVPANIGFQFVMTLDFAHHTGSNHVGFQCDTGEVMDRLYNKCRRVYCKSGEEFSHDLMRCVPVQDDTNKSHTTTTSTTTAPSPITGTIAMTQILKFRKMPGNTIPIRTTPPHHQMVVPTAGSIESTTRPSTAAETNTSHPVPTSGVNTSLPTNKDLNDCPFHVVVPEADFTTQTNGSLYVPAHGRTYQDGEYEAREGGVLVCWSGDSESGHKFSLTLRWVSVVGLSFSCLALVLHLTAFCLVPNLRKLSGKCLASLCVSLLAAYITFLLNVSAQSSQAGCVTLAAARYYFFLCYFGWMTVIAFDVWYTFRLTHTHLRVAGGTENSRFLPYSLCSWLLPAVCTAVLVVVDQLEPHGVSKDFLPRLVKPLCWISNRKSLLVFFATPMAAFTLMNVVFFVSTAALITKMNQSVAEAATPEASSKRRQRYWSFLRLAVMMGLTWITGILAGCFDLEPLWYVFVVLNSLQGVFIFLAFTCRSQVLQEVGLRGHTLLQRVESLVSRRPLHSDNALELR